MIRPKTMSSLLKTLSIQLPIIQAPMAGVSTPKMAAEVSNSGGLGSIGLGAMSVETARKAIQEIRASTDRPFNVNLFCHASAKRDAKCEKAWIEYLEPYFGDFEAKAPVELTEIYESFLTNEPMMEMLLQVMVIH